jgi:hypothetical protein
VWGDVRSRAKNGLAISGAEADEMEEHLRGLGYIE